MTVMLDRPALVGCQRPRIELAPLVGSSAGDDAIECAASAGLILDDFQQYVLRRSLGELPNGRWASPDVAVVLARQQGKTEILVARELAGLFVFDEELLIHTAHEMKAAAVVFRRLVSLISGSPHLSRRVRNIAYSKGDEGIELHSGARLRFMARTGGSGRSFSAQFLALDEAYALPSHTMNALLPTLAAQPNPQVWYMSSAVNQREQPHGLTLARVRRRALAGDDPRLAYFEWSGDEDAYRADPRGYASDPVSWAVASPALGTRMPPEFLSDQLRRLGPDGFAAEHLSIGDWPEEPADHLPRLVEPDVWDALTDRMSTAVDPVSFGVHASPNQASASVCVAGRRVDGKMHVEVVQSERGITWVVDFVRGLVERQSPCAVVVDPGGPAGQLITPLQYAGVDVVKMTAGSYKQACAAWMTAVSEGGLRHQNDPRLTDAVLQAQTRELMQGWVVDQNASPGDVSSLVAVILAMHGLVEHEHDSGGGGWMISL